MNTDLTFLLEAASTLDTLESVLATVRRGGLRLQHLRLDGNGHDNVVYLRLAADDADRIDLFTARLANIIGVHEICHPPVGQLYISA